MIPAVIHEVIPVEVIREEHNVAIASAIAFLRFAINRLSTDRAPGVCRCETSR